MKAPFELGGDSTTKLMNKAGSRDSALFISARLRAISAHPEPAMSIFQLIQHGIEGFWAT